MQDQTKFSPSSESDSTIWCALSKDGSKIIKREGMLAFSYPYVFALVLAPVLARILIPACREPRPAVQVPFMERLSRLTGQTPATGAAIERHSIPHMLFNWVCWLLVVAALARPQWIEAPLTKTVPTRDLLLAVDLSGSMEIEDFTDENGGKTDRLTAVKQVLDEFLTRREGDRTGLIFFGSAPFVQAPFTEDFSVVRTLLDEARVRMAGPQTMLGDAIGLAINVFEQSETEERVLILLTDGNDTGSRAPPQKAAEIARDKGIAVHAVAVGDPMAAGEEKLDEETLKAIANITGGGYFRAMDREELEDVYRRLDELDTRKIETVSHRPKRDLFHWPLTAFFVLSLAYYAAGALRRKKRTGAANTRTRTVAALSLSIFGFGIVAASIFSGAFTALCASENFLSFSSFSSFSGFHFLRPWFLVGLIPALLVAWLSKKRQDRRGPWEGVVSEHLLKHLLIEDVRRRKFRPLHLLALTWCSTVLALSGPTWRQEPSPFSEDQAALFIVLKTAPSMTAKDVQPSRLQRAVHKIGDLCALRAGASHGLIAYSGSAHLAVPLTKDANIIRTFAAELSPGIMPREGDVAADALALAEKRLRRSGLPGSVLLIADEIPPEQEKKIAELKSDWKFPVHVLATANPPDEKSMGNAARSLDGSLTVVTADDSDVERIASRVEKSLQTFAQTRQGARWRDTGYLLVPLIAFFSLAWFRKGWVVRYD